MCNVPCNLCGDFYECDVKTKFFNIIKKFCDKVHGNCYVCEHADYEIEESNGIKYKKIYGCKKRKEIM